jgi:apolipoprotein N-acyltransferase
MLICYEDLLPAYARRVAVHNPNVLINLTNDAWFGKTAEPEHHLNLALMRSVEYRRWLLRSTNTGISVFIDAVGRRVAQTRLDDAETLLRAVPLLEGQTVYARLGDWPLLLLALVCGVLLMQALRGGGAAAAGQPKAKTKPRGKSKAPKG